MDDRRRDGGTNFILRIKEQETRLTLHEHDDDEDELFCVVEEVQQLSRSAACCDVHFSV